MQGKTKRDHKLTAALEVVDGVLRSWWTIVAGLALGAAAALVSLHFLPKIYEATTKIYVASGTLPDNLVPTTVSDDMRMRMTALQEAVLSRPYLERIVGEHYQPAPEGPALDSMIASIRGRVLVDVARGFFSITYRDNDPERAARVANELAQLYIDENAEFRATRAGEATETLEALAEGVLAELSAKEQAILEYKMKHPFETEANRDTNIRMREVLQREQETLKVTLAIEEEKLRSLKGQLARASSPESVPLPEVIDDPATLTLARLQRELADLRSAYTETHPAVRAKVRELEDFQRSQIGAATAHVDGSQPVTPAVARLRLQIEEQERALERLLSQQEKKRAEIARYDARIEATPIVEARLAELGKGLDILLQQYRDYQTKAEAAKGAQKMEEGRKGVQFEIIERARAASVPVRPVKPFVFGGHVGIGLLLFVGPLVVRRLLNPVILSQTALRGFSDVPLLVAIPALPTPDVAREARRRRVQNLGISTLALAALVAAVALVSL
jgi:polysaccharide chain length determinant protein (PEP-CTERM system associated)